MTAGPAWLDDLRVAVGAHPLGADQLAAVGRQLGLAPDAPPDSWALLEVACSLTLSPLDRSDLTLSDLPVLFEVAHRFLRAWAQHKDPRAAQAVQMLGAWHRNALTLSRGRVGVPDANHTPLLAAHYRLGRTRVYWPLIVAAHRGVRVACIRLARAAQSGALSWATARERAARFLQPLVDLGDFLPVGAFGGYTDGVPSARILRALSLAQRKRDLLDPTGGKYAALAAKLLSGSYEPGEVVPPEMRVVRPLRALPSLDGSVRVTPIPFTRDVTEAIREGVPALEAGTLVWADSDAPAALTADAAGLCLADDFPWWGDKHVPRLGDAARALAALQTNPAAFANALTATLFGWRRGRLGGVQLESEEPPCVVSQRAMILAQHAPEGLADGTGPYCEAGGDLVPLPLAGLLWELVHALRKAGFTHLLDVRQRRAILCSIRSATGDRSIKGGVDGLARMFLPFAVSRYGVDPVLGSYITGEFPFAVRVPGVYTRFDAVWFGSKALELHEEFYNELRRASGNALPAWQQSPWIPADLQSTGVEGIGSRHVPRKAPFAAWSCAYEAYLLTGGSLPNSICCKIHKRAVDLMVLTGIRPDELSEVVVKGVDLDGRRLFIVGAGSRFTIEPRCVVLVPEAVAVVREALAARNALLEWAGAAGSVTLAASAHRVADRLFITIDSDGQLGPLTARDLRRGLDALEPTLGPFPGPLNGPRHLVRSALTEAGAPFEVSNALLGHQAVGQEFLHCAALGSIGQLRYWVEPVLRALVPLIGWS